MLHSQRNREALTCSSRQHYAARAPASFATTPRATGLSGLLPQRVACGLNCRITPSEGAVVAATAPKGLSGLIGHIRPLIAVSDLSDVNRHLSPERTKPQPSASSFSSASLGLGLSKARRWGVKPAKRQAHWPIVDALLTKERPQSQPQIANARQIILQKKAKSLILLEAIYFQLPPVWQKYHTINCYTETAREAFDFIIHSLSPVVF